MRKKENQLRLAVDQLIFLFIIVISALGYSEFYSNYTRAFILVFVIILLKYCFKCQINDERVYILWSLYLFISMILIRTYLEGTESGLTISRFAYILIFPLALSGAYVYGSKLYYDKSSVFLFILLLLIVIVGLYQTFSDTYVAKYNEEGEFLILEGVPWYGRRVSSFVGNANALGGLTSLILIFNLFSRSRFIKYGTIVLAFICLIILAKSRSSLFIALLSCILFFISQRKYFQLIIFTAGVCSLVYFILPHIISDEVLNTLFRFEGSDWGIKSYTERIAINSSAIDIWLNHYFLFGVGYDAESYALWKYDAYSSYSESIYVKLLLELGLIGYVGLILSILLYGKDIIIKAKLNGLKNLLMIFTVAWLIYGMMETAALMPSVMLPTAIMLGTITSKADYRTVAKRGSRFEK